METLVSYCCGDNWLDIQAASGAAERYQVHSWDRAWATIDVEPASFGRRAGLAQSGSQMPDGYNGSGGAALLRDPRGALVTIGAGALPARTPVQLRMTVWFSGSIDADGVGDSAANGQATAALHFGGWDAPWITGIDVEAGKDRSSMSWTGQVQSSAIVDAFVGDTLHLVGDLRLRWNQRNGYFSGRNGFAGQTQGEARYFVDVLTTGAFLGSASGFNYATPVPEPAAVVLLLAGLAAVVARARRPAPA